MKDVKAFLSKLNYKIPNNKIRELFSEVERNMQIGYVDFTLLYNKIIFDEKVSVVIIINSSDGV